MPQLDFFSILNQIFWGIFYSGLFYFFMEMYIVPTLFASIFAREFFKKNSSSDVKDNNIYFSFFIFSFLVGTISDYSTSIFSSFSEQQDLEFSYFAAVSECVNLEIKTLINSQQLFEEIDTNILKHETNF